MAKQPVEKVPAQTFDVPVHDLTKPLERLSSVHGSVCASGDVREAKVLDTRWLEYDELERSGGEEYHITIWFNDEDAWPDDAPGRVEEASASSFNDGLVIKHGCHTFHSFEEAFNHYDPRKYNSDGDVADIREAYRRMQEHAIDYGWVSERAPNSVVSYVRTV